MYDEPVVTYYGTADKAIEDEPTLVYWVFVEPLQLGTISTLYIRDGHSTSDPIVAKIAVGDSRVSPFYPPIRCAHGLYIDIDAWVTSYTVGYLRERDAYDKKQS